MYGLLTWTHVQLQQIQELVEAIVLPMTHKERFQKLGIRPPKGVLLYGPPGTGKTLMARACAAQTNATFLKLAGPQLVQIPLLFLRLPEDIHHMSHASRLRHWVVMGLALLVLGITLHFTDAIPLNKQLYTFSYVSVTSGAAALVFSAFYVLVDIGNVKFMFLPLEWIGMNAMLVYVMAAEGIFAAFINGWYYDDPHNTLVV
ncbi:hypothetical protein RHGRI_014481 [Rhododendron griersonianum]|uniref:ATPase AAA-type core domain-containing protein n=1 Tax=Rhododendron griersonianum TaxID=479676 RepID=A0AAV6K9T8_9ERIC|nr:hypothetical protein RHGRI_014481 [Rhododendron griersonianum]